MVIAMKPIIHKDSLGDRMKAYENVSRVYLTRRMPVIIRCDGRAFHGLELDKPYDQQFMGWMVQAALETAQHMQGFQAAYIQSDEVSFLLVDYETIEAEAWFNYNINKLNSISAALMSVVFNSYTSMYEFAPAKTIVFDARSFNVPREDVVNYFLWRVKDWNSNSLSMLCQANFSHEQLKGKSKADQHEMLHGIGKNWAECTDREKNGTMIVKMPNSSLFVVDLREEMNYTALEEILNKHIYVDLYKKPEVESGT